MTITPEHWQTFAALIMIFSLLGGGVLALRRLGFLPSPRSSGTDGPAPDIAVRLTRHEARIAGLEKAVATLASREDIHKIELALGRQEGALREVRATIGANHTAMDRLGAAITRIEDHLMGEGR